MALQVTATKYRPGISTATTLSPIWLYFTGARTATARLNRGANIRIGDMLLLSTSVIAGRVFQITGLMPQPNGFQASLQEIFYAIPDEFNCINNWWTQSVGTFTINIDGYADKLSIPLSNTAVLSCPFMYQTINGDFDVWAEFTIPDAASVLTRVGLIVRLDASTQMLALKYLSSGVNAVATYGYGDGSWGLELATPTYLRAKRVGQHIRFFYSQLTYEPTTETDWSPCSFETNGYFVSSEALQVGIGGFANPANVGTCSFFRNWKGVF